MFNEKGSKPKLILGTVQLGQRYGVNNTVGKPSIRQAFDILDYAYKNGIDMLDTAAAYGESEEIIGKYHKNTGNYFNICTKLPINQPNLIEFDASLERLCIDKVAVLFLHRFEQIYDKSIIDYLLELKKNKVVEHIGVSIYSPDELNSILLEFSDIFDVVQIPFNILDNTRWKVTIRESHKKNISIFTRSVFLQGLLFKFEKDPFVQKLGAEKYIKYINGLATSKNVTVSNVLLNFNKLSDIDGILVGCETVDQLKNNIEMFYRTSCLSIEDLQDIDKNVSDIDEKVIDPRRWQDI